MVTSKIKSCKQTQSFLWYSDSLTKKQKKKIAKIVQIAKRRKKRRNYDYKEKLTAKRKLTYLYGNLSKKAIKSFKIKAKRFKSYSTSGLNNKLLSLLERRLDSCLFRTNFFYSFSQAKQYIHHSKILVNSKIVTSPSFMLKPGDVISVNCPSNLKVINKKKITRNFKKTHILYNLKKNLKKRTAKIFVKIKKKNNKNLKFSKKKKIKNYNEKRKAQIIKPSFMYSNEIKGEESLNTFLKISELKEICEKKKIKNYSKKKKAQIIDSISYYKGSKRETYYSEIKKKPLKTFVCKSKVVKKTKVRKIKTRRIKLKNKKPQHLEINYKILTAIYLYTPQLLQFPTFINAKLALS